MKKDKKRSIFKENVKTIIIVLVVIMIVAGSFIYNKFFNYKEIYTVVKGSVEKVSDTYVYVLKNEKVLDVDKTSVAIPILEQGARASKGEIIAVYKNSSYEENQKEILELDKQIQTLVKDLPSVYSADVNTIDLQIAKLIKEAQEENSYVKMQDFKNKVNDLLSKKINILGELSPSGSKIRELIDERNKLENESKNSNSNIKALVAGDVTYKIDGLENILNYEDVLTFSPEKLDEIIKEYSNNNTNNFGVKIVDNFECYYLVKVLDDENTQYMKPGRKYQIKLMDSSSDVSNYVTLQSSIKSNEYIYNIFKVDNNISDIIDLREVGAEVIWKKEEGLVVPLEAIIEENGIKYVTLVSGGEYIKVPIKVTISNNSIGIIENYSKEEKQELNIDSKYIISIYDQILIDTQN